MRLIQIVMVVALLALGAGLVVRGLMAPDRPVSQALLPEFEFPDISDKKHSSSEWQGKIRVINFWATWCPPCIKEIPEFVELQTQLGDKGVQFIGIAIEDKVPVEQYLAINTVNYPLLVADFAGVALAHQLGNTVDAVPYTLVVNQKGEIIHEHQGAISKEQLLEVIQPLLN